MRTLISKLGFINAVLFVIQRILFRISAGHIRLVKYYIYGQPLITHRSGRGKKISITPAMADNDNIFAAPRRREMILARLEQGSQCLLAEKEGEFLGFLWLKRDDYQEDEVRCHYLLLPKGNYAWDYDVYVAPTARLGYAFLRLWEEAGERLAEQGIKATISRIDAFNTHSLRSHERLGARRLGWLQFICIGRYQLMLGSYAPYIHLSCSAANEPAVQVHVDPDKLQNTG